MWTKHKSCYFFSQLEVLDPQKKTTFSIQSFTKFEPVRLHAYDCSVYVFHGLNLHTLYLGTIYLIIYFFFDIVSICTKVLMQFKRIYFCYGNQSTHTDREKCDHCLKHIQREGLLKLKQKLKKMKRTMGIYHFKNVHIPNRIQMNNMKKYITSFRISLSNGYIGNIGNQSFCYLHAIRSCIRTTIKAIFNHV